MVCMAIMLRSREEGIGMKCTCFALLMHNDKDTDKCLNYRCLVITLAEFQAGSNFMNFKSR